MFTCPAQVLRYFILSHTNSILCTHPWPRHYVFSQNSVITHLARNQLLRIKPKPCYYILSDPRYYVFNQNPAITYWTRTPLLCTQPEPHYDTLGQNSVITYSTRSLLIQTLTGSYYYAFRPSPVITHTAGAPLLQTDPVNGFQCRRNMSVASVFMVFISLGYLQWASQPAVITITERGNEAN